MMWEPMGRGRQPARFLRDVARYDARVVVEILQRG
ncbi:MAG: hypothetical protein QOI81_416 [Actinomycetota bacterium]|nr:hypothetical protein [Actinomycetota bacterium]